MGQQNKAATEALGMLSKTKEMKNVTVTSTKEERKTSKKESASGLARLIAANSQEEAKNESTAEEVTKSMDPMPQKETEKETAMSNKGFTAEALEMLSERKEMKNESERSTKEERKTSKKESASGLAR